MNSRGKEYRTVQWVEGDSLSGRLRTINQTMLPEELVWHDCVTLEDAWQCINQMIVRGAPAIGSLAAYGMVLALRQYHDQAIDNQMTQLLKAKEYLDSARPTAVTLSWGTQRIMDFALAVSVSFKNNADNTGIHSKRFCEYILEEAERIADEDVAINQKMARIGAEVVPQNANILHHCNTGALATVDIGTAIGVIYECHYQKKNVHVWVDETRPRLQGARLSAWELMRENVPMHLIADNAAGLLMLNRKVDIVLYGADRVAANGDVVNKIGTYKISVVAKENNIPVFAVVPTSTIDLNVSSGNMITIEERNDEEVTMVGNTRIAPLGVKVYNPAFDITPFKYLTGIITEEGICYPPFNESLKRAKDQAQERINQIQSQSFVK